ncbi:MAG: hypothetical protein L0213_11775, partial [Candidatus Dadabacteria bacterium]|nr:hypothetical protein [Candidatus Dadabacteria bacterium]
TLRGESTRFSAVVSSMGVVVSVRRDERMITQIIRDDTSAPFIRPCSVTFRKPMGKGGMERPGVKKRWAVAANRKSQIKGTTPRITEPIGMLESLIIRMISSAIKRNAAKLSIKKTITIRIISRINFVLGSSRWTKESTGIY